MSDSEASSILPASAQYHIGIMSHDPAATMDALTKASGYVWAEEIGGPVTVELPDGETVIELKAWYSVTEPRLEVVQAIPDSVWTPVADSDIHHFGYWVEDVVKTCAGLEEQGYEIEVLGKRPGGPAYWAYLRKPSLPRVEVVSSALRPMMEQYFATGRIPAAARPK